MRDKYPAAIVSPCDKYNSRNRGFNIPDKSESLSFLTPENFAVLSPFLEISSISSDELSNVRFYICKNSRCSRSVFPRKQREDRVSRTIYVIICMYVCYLKG